LFLTVKQVIALLKKSADRIPFSRIAPTVVTNIYIYQHTELCLCHLTYNLKNIHCSKEKFMRVKLWRLLVGAAVCNALVFTGAFAAEKSKDANVIKDGSVVSLEYTLSGEDGKTIESNKGKAPLKYTHGGQQIVPGLEKNLTGMKMGEEKRVKVNPEEGYGPVDPKGFQEFPKDKIPSEGLKVGAVLTARGPQGQQVPVRVHEIKEKTVVLDLNHPMAGKTLVFDIKVLDVQPASASQPPQPGQPSAPQQPAKPAQPAAPK
jgi:FKBP-type peptidyl-prolyl cis-trans isomerase SlyD